MAKTYKLTESPFACVVDDGVDQVALEIIQPAGELGIAYGETSEATLNLAASILADQAGLDILDPLDPMRLRLNSGSLDDLEDLSARYVDFAADELEGLSVSAHDIPESTVTSWIAAFSPA